MGLTSSSTRADALAQYNDNLAWEGNPAKASLALEAIRWLLVNRPTRLTESNRSIDYETLIQQESKLAGYVALHSSSVHRAPFTEGRMRV